MRVSELMIGDWIETFPDYSKVLSIDKKGRIWTTEASNYELKFATGITLTSEMLLVNGFEIINEKYCAPAYLKECNDCELTIYQEGCDIFTWRIRIQRGPDASVSIRTRYVHELQNAMRLMGLYKMADSFKIEKEVVNENSN